MNNGQNQQLEQLKLALQSHEEVMMEMFIKEGPDALRNFLGVIDESDWKIIFDYLVMRRNVLEKCALNYLPFFKEIVEKYGPKVLKLMFKIDDPGYSESYERLLDLVAVSHGAIYNYVRNNCQVLASKILNGDAKSLRDELGLGKRKYDGLWAEILDILMNSCCHRVDEERQLEEGIRRFSLLMTAVREQRSLRSFNKMWEYA
ncbi:hypothetical protein KBB06_01750 [Candidatus Gracilibacteria bacterium]|nr:hypothetical protein [Candidatus Gracilibacteria bacterium]